MKFEQKAFSQVFVLSIVALGSPNLWAATGEIEPGKTTGTAAHTSATMGNVDSSVDNNASTMTNANTSVGVAANSGADNFNDNNNKTNTNTDTVTNSTTTSDSKVVNDVYADNANTNSSTTNANSDNANSNVSTNNSDFKNDSVSNAQATATSDGIIDNSTDDHVDSSVKFKIMAYQDLASNNTGNSIQIEGDGNSQGSGLQTGSNVIGNGALANFSGILNSAWNTGHTSSSQAANNMASQADVSFGN